MSVLSGLNIKIFADGADRAGIIDLFQRPYIQGLTTNPTLMRKAGVKDYEAFARDILSVVTTKPLSLEVLADDFPEMHRQARKIASWGKNVYVKIPISNTQAESAVPLIGDLVAEGIKVNVTAILDIKQVHQVAAVLNPNLPAVVSIFAGRIADTGIDPVPVMREGADIISSLPQAELLWASVREVINLLQAERCGCDIITVTHDILAKAEKTLGMSLTELSLDTVRMFSRDAIAADYRL